MTAIDSVIFVYQGLKKELGQDPNQDLKLLPKTDGFATLDFFPRK